MMIDVGRPGNAALLELVQLITPPANAGATPAGTTTSPAWSVRRPQVRMSVNWRDTATTS